MGLQIPDHMTGRTDQTFQRDRYMLEHMGVQPGVVPDAVFATPLKVSQRAAGADRTVDIAGGAAWVRGTNFTREGLYHTFNDGTVNLADTGQPGAFSPNTSGNPRVDRLALKVNTSNANGTDTPVFLKLEGTPTAGTQVTAPQTTATYQLGAAPVPATAILLAEWVSANAYTQILSTQIVDRRPWAKGAFRQIVRFTANYTAGGGDTTYHLVDATNLQPRIECSGVPLRLTLSTWAQGSTTTNTIVGFMQDGAAFASRQQVNVPAASSNIPVQVSTVIVPVAGSHLFAPAFAAAAGTLTLIASSATDPLIFTVEELIRQNADNT